MIHLQHNHNYDLTKISEILCLVNKQACMKIDRITDLNVTNVGRITKDTPKPIFSVEIKVKWLGTTQEVTYIILKISREVPI